MTPRIDAHQHDYCHWPPRELDAIYRCTPSHHT